MSAVVGLTTRIAAASAAGPTSYSNANRPVIAVPGIRNIINLINVRITGGYTAKGVVQDNGRVQVTVYSTNTTNGLLAEVANGTNLSAETITVVVQGV